MSDQLDTIITELRAMREEMNTAMELLAIASPGTKDCHDELNEIIQAALPFVNSYYPGLDGFKNNSEACQITVSFGSLRRLIAAISKVTAEDLR